MNPLFPEQRCRVAPAGTGRCHPLSLDAGLCCCERVACEQALQSQVAVALSPVTLLLPDGAVMKCSVTCGWAIWEP